MTMRAMVLESAGQPLVLRDLPVPEPAAGQVLVKVQACGVCRTDLHVLDGDLTEPKYPLILGHEIVGTVAALGEGVSELMLGQRVGVPWLGSTCGHCRYCVSARENLCADAGFTGYQVDGGYAEYTVAHQRYCFAVPERYDSVQAAPFLCAGLIGYRAYRMAGTAPRLGLYGFGAAAHILVQLAVAQGREVYAFTRAGDERAQVFARRLGAVWAGDSNQTPPAPLDAAIIFAPVGALVPGALRAVDPGGVVVCAGIHMSDIPTFPYSILWQERSIRSVANLTRRDGVEFFAAIEQYPVRTETEPFSLDQANDALARLRDGRIQGAAVLSIA